MSFVQTYLANRHRRAVGSIMGYCETEVFPLLSKRDQDRLRAKVRGTLGEYHDSVIDVVKSSTPDGTSVNEDALRLLARVDSHMAEERRARTEERRG